MLCLAFPVHPPGKPEKSRLEELDAVTVPTLILWGEQDALRPVVYARIFHERIRGSVLRVYPRVGHFPMEEAADATAADVRAFMRQE